MHLTVDGHGGDHETLADEATVRRFLDECPDTIGMTKITAPFVYCYRGGKPEDWGYSGFILIAESHISIHTFPTRGLVWADIFSCKGFNPELVLNTLTDLFQLREVNPTFLQRGLEYAEQVAPLAIAPSA